MHLSDQVTAYLADNNLSANPDALHVLFIGGNDIADAVRVLAPDCDPSGVTSVLMLTDGVPPALPGQEEPVGALESVANHILALYGAGARRFLVLNSPDLGLTPAFNPPLNLPQASGAATCLSLLYNFGTQEGSPVPPECGFPPGIPGLVNVVAELSQLPGMEMFIGVDIYTNFVQLVEAAKESETQNGTDTCVMPDSRYEGEDPPPYACKNPDDYVFWDGIHPTRATHGVIRDVVAAALGE